MSPKTLCLAVFLVGAFAAAALGQTLPPDDSAKHHVLILAEPDDSRLASWFQHDAGLKRLVGRVHFNQIAATNPLYAARYEGSVPRQELPAVLFMRADGGVIFKASRQTMPRSAAVLYSEMKEAYRLARETVPGSGEQIISDDSAGRVLPFRRIRDTRLIRPPAAFAGDFSIPAAVLGAVVALAILIPRDRR